MIDEEHGEAGPNYISLVSVIEAVCEVFGVTREELFCHARPPRLAHPRFAMYYLGWLNTKRSLSSIGRFMERDHTTILYGRDKCIELKRSNEEYADKLEAAKELAFEIELRKELAAKQELSEIQKKVEEQEKRENEARRKLEKTRQSLSKKGVLCGDKVIFARVNSYG